MTRLGYFYWLGYFWKLTLIWKKKLSNPKSWPTFGSFLPQQLFDIFILINTFKIWFVVGISVFQKWFDEDVCLVFQIKFRCRYFGTFSRQLFWVFFLKIGQVFPNHRTPLNIRQTIDICGIIFLTASNTQGRKYKSNPTP